MKHTQIEKAIESLEADKQVIELAIARLKAQATAKPKREKKAVKGAEVKL